MDYTENQLQVFQIFFPYAFRKHTEFRASNTRLVHYTSAEAAVNIVRTKQVWMRNSTAVNDFMEIEHGFACLNEAYKGDHGAKLKKTLNEVHPGFFDELEQKFNAWLPHFRTDTYIVALSEHLDSEDRFGRLSMWRAYGGQTGVALVLNNAPFLSNSNALKAFSSPVSYLNAEAFNAEFGNTVSNILSNLDFVSTLPRDTLMNTIFAMMRLAILCTKHPGFHEEREWRIIYSPKYERSDKLTSSIEVVRGAPQIIYKIPLKDFPEEDFTGAEIPTLLERVIIGPTQYPLTVHDAIVTLLEGAGVPSAQGKVWVSDIPLRQ